MRALHRPRRPHCLFARRLMVSAGLVGALGLGFMRLGQAETGVNDLRIRIGQSAVFSGVAQDFGIDYRAGIQLAFDSTNKAGGVFGRRLELVSYDDAYEPKRTADNTEIGRASCRERV